RGERGAASFGFDELYRLASAGLVDIVDDDFRAFAGEQACGGSPGASAAGAGHDRHFVLEGQNPMVPANSGCNQSAGWSVSRVCEVCLSLPCWFRRGLRTRSKLSANRWNAIRRISST